MSKTNAIGVWYLEEAAGSGRVDSSDAGNTLTETPSTVLRSTGRVGNAVGPFSSDCIRRTNANLSATFPGKNGGTAPAAFTVAWWAFPLTAPGSSYTMIHKGNSFWSEYFADGHFTFVMNATSTIATAASFSAGAWYHFVARWQGDTDDELSLWFNGVKQATTHTLSSLMTSTDDFIVGAWTNIGGFAFDGLIDELCVYTRALKDWEIQLLYSGTLEGFLGTPDVPYFPPAGGAPPQARPLVPNVLRGRPGRTPPLGRGVVRRGRGR